MSSDMKDARWGLAYHYAKREGKTYEDYEYPQWQALLDTAQAELDQYPEDIRENYLKGEGGTMSEAKYLVFDAETTGIEVHEDRIVQWFMATADADGNLIDEREWLINPGVSVPEEAAEVHGFTTRYLERLGRDPHEALTEIAQTFRDNLDLIHVAFNLAFDLSILDAEFKRHRVSENFGAYMRDEARLVDAIVIDRYHDKYRKGKRTLEAQAKHYGVPFDPDAAHDARYDVEATAKVTVKVLEKFGTPTTAEQKAWYADWAQGLEDYLRRSDPDARVDPNWPLKINEKGE